MIITIISRMFSTAWPKLSDKPALAAWPMAWAVPMGPATSFRPKRPVNSPFRVSTTMRAMESVSVAERRTRLRKVTASGST